MSKKFDEFYYLKDNEKHNINEISEYVSSQKDGNYTPYQGLIYCPECQKAKLTYIHKTTNKGDYLKKIPSSQHHNWCSYFFDISSKKEIEIYFGELNEDQIIDKIDSVMRFLLKDKTNNSNTITANNFNSLIKSNPTIIQSKGSKIYKTIPRKSINTKLDDLPNDTPFIFYGTVKLSVETIPGKRKSDGKDFIYNKLIIKTQNKHKDWVFTSRIYRGGFKDQVNENMTYKVVLIGYKDNWDIKLINKLAIKYEVLPE
ncbi:hypothetical protein RYD26_06500 [Pasteurellaceae bacterium LIM206]|nr:hypothetical protein [Pasteurellaceae bacterium LIM206]